VRTHRVAIIGGDGIGPEVIEAGCRVLEALADAEGDFGFAFRPLRLGLGPLPSPRRHNAGRRPVAAGESRRDLLRRGRRSFAPGRPHPVGLAARHLPGLRPVRECAADPVSAGDRRPSQAGARSGDRLGNRAGEQRGRVRGRRRRAHRGLPIEVGMDVAVFTRAGVERIAALPASLPVHGRAAVSRS
jgi:tartrate dehydrogenase/decarboxylase/D-malate dehydrogenase